MTLREYIEKVVIVYHRHQGYSRVKKIIDWATRKKLIDLVEHNGKLVPKLMTWECPHCKKLHYLNGYSRDMVKEASARTATSTEAAIPGGKEIQQEFCINCVEGHCFTCQRSGIRYVYGPFSITSITVRDHNEMWCVEKSLEYLVKHPTTGQWLSAVNVQGYHHGIRDWDVPEGQSDNFFGVELEILSGMAKGSKEFVIRTAVECGLAAERDGSLDATYGIEIVGPPLIYDSVITPEESNPWFKFLQAIQGKAKGWDAGQGYGMHVNLNTQAFGMVSKEHDNESRVVSTTNLSKFVSFICCNETLGKIIAGRTQTQYASYLQLEQIGGSKGMLSAIRGYDPDRGRMGQSTTTSPTSVGDFVESLRASFRPARRNVDRRAQTMMKYLACSIRSRYRVEVRMFRSTIRWDRFIRNLQYCHSVKEYTAQASNLTYYHANNYLHWLGKNQHHYPELASFLFASPLGSQLGCKPHGKTERLDDLSKLDGDVVEESMKLKLAARKVLVH